MGIIQDILAKVRAKKEKYAEAEDDIRMQKRLQEKQLNANERELNRYMEEDRQRMIKSMLEKYRKRKKDEFWHGNRLLDKKNIFQNHPSIMRNNTNLYRGRSLYLYG